MIIKNKGGYMQKFTVDRKRAENAFRNYTMRYDASDEKVRLKIEHTFRVAELCGKIAASEGQAESAVDLAWTAGILHDVGRFEQLRRYGTFVDALSVDHAQLGADILFGDTQDEWKRREGAIHSDTGCAQRRNTKGMIGDFINDSSEDALIETAIRSHNLLCIDPAMSDRTRFFCNVLRDADKVDILKVNVDFAPEDIYNTTAYELRHCRVSDEVMQSFDSDHAIMRKLRKTPADFIVGIISLAYELVFPYSREEVARQGYLSELCRFRSEDPVTEKQFEHIRMHMQDYMKTASGSSGKESC
jgi:putative nucleotidyltransferase with HDIG domain